MSLLENLKKIPIFHLYLMPRPEERGYSLILIRKPQKTLLTLEKFQKTKGK